MKSILKLFLLLVLCFGALSALPETVSAQGGCQDASGSPIPCPTEEPEDDNDSKRATPTQVPPTRAPNTATPTPTNTPEPTPTPLPISIQPTEEPDTGKAEWSGVCKDSTCIAQFTNGCTNVGGTVETGEIKDGAVPLTCKVPMEEYEPGIMIAAAPTKEPGSAKAEWSGTCKDTTCIGQFTNGCESVGGTVEIGKIEKGEVPLTCKVPMEEYEPEMGIVAVPSDPQPEPRPGSGFPPGGWLPWAAGLGGLLIGLLLPAVQKVRDAAEKPKARNPGPKSRENILLDKDTEPQPAAVDYFLEIEGIKGESTDAPPAEDKPQIKNNEGDGGTEAAYIKYDDIKGESKD